MIYDAFGRELKPAKRPDDAVTAAASLRDRWSEYPSGGLTPQRLATILKEADAGDVYRQMELFEEMEEKDTHLASILQTRKLAVKGLDYSVVPVSEDTRDRDIADFVTECIQGLPDFEDNCFDALDAVGKGFSGLELYWDIRADKNVVRHIEWIHPKRFTWVNSTVPRLLTDSAPAMGIDLAPFKFIFHIHKTKSGHPMRQGCLRVCAWMYLFKNYNIKDWVAFAEVYGMPLRLGKYDPSATKEDKEALIQAVRSLGSDAAGIISKSTEIEFVEAVKNSGNDVYEVLAAFCNAEMSKAILGQTLTTQQGDSGSYGLGKVHNEVREDIRKADCESLSKTLRRDLIRPLVGFNFGWDVPLPWIRFDYDDPDDLNSEADRYKTLIESGLPITEDHIYEKFGIPKPKSGEKVVSFGKIGAETITQANKGLPAVSADSTTTGQEPHPADGLIERLMNEADFDPLMEPVARLVAEAATLEDLRDKLLDLYKEMDETALGELLARAFAAAGLLGRYKAATEAK